MRLVCIADTVLSMKIVTGLANGQICVLYSPQTSVNGAKLLLNKGPPRKATIEDMSDAVSAPTIITPHALPMFRDGEIARGSKRKREKDRMDPRKSRRPELPVTGPGKGGRVGASATQHVVQNLVRDTTRDEDVSTAFLIVRSASRRDSRRAGAMVSTYLLSLLTPRGAVVLCLVRRAQTHCRHSRHCHSVAALGAKTGPSMVVSTGALAVACATRRNHASRCREAPSDGGIPVVAVSSLVLYALFLFRADHVCFPAPGGTTASRRDGRPRANVDLR